MLNQLTALYQEQDLDCAIDKLFVITEDNFVNKEFDKVNEVLELVDFSQLNSVLVEGLLRSTYRFQHLLPAWAHALSRAEKELSLRPEAQYDLLCGLTN